MDQFPSREGLDGGNPPAAGNVQTGPACGRCGEPVRGVTARYCARCGLRLPPYNPDWATYAEAMNRGHALRDGGGLWNADAIWWFYRAMAARPEAIDPLLDIAQAHFKQHHYWRARRWYARIVRGRPDCFEAWRRGADCFPRDAHMRRACWLLRAYMLSPGDMDVLDELTYHLGQLSNLRRWRIYQAFWRAYDAVWPAVQKTKQPHGFWNLPFIPVSKEWELMIREWASNKRAGIKPFTGAGPAGRFGGMGGAWTG